MNERNQVCDKVCSALETGYVALLGQRDADLPAAVRSILNSDARLPGMKFVSITLPKGMHDSDEFRALVLQRLLQSAVDVPPETSLSKELELVLAQHEARTLDFRLHMALETLGKRTSAAYLVIILQALPEVPQEPLKNLLQMLRDYHDQRQFPGTAGAKMRFLATGNEALWRLCYRKAPDASPFNIAERIWVGGLAYQEVQSLCNKRNRLEKAVRLKCLTDGIPSLVHLALKRDTEIWDLSPFFGELQDHWNSLSLDSQESLKRVVQGSENFPSCLPDYGCPQIPDLNLPWIEAFWAGFLRVSHQEVAWRSPIHRAFVMQHARIKQVDFPTAGLKGELPDRSFRLEKALKNFSHYEDSEECLEEAVVLAVLSNAVELAELLDMVWQQQPFDKVLERLRAGASETNSPSLQKLSEQVARQKHAMSRLLVKASLQAVSQHIPEPQRKALPVGRRREPARDKSLSRRNSTGAAHSTRSGELIRRKLGFNKPITFDVFLSHNTKDKRRVRALCRKLRHCGLRVWLDEEQLRPGIPWQQLLEEGVKGSSSIAVLVGNDGLGPWENEEMQAALSLAVKDKRPVIPILLPGAPIQPELPMFLGNRIWIDLREGLTEARIGSLIWGITGKKP
jgi:hypothetical protein